MFLRVEEGLAVFSRFPIVSHAYRLLPRDPSDPDDYHQRACLRVDVATAAGPMQVFVTHLSLRSVCSQHLIARLVGVFFPLCL